ncbi:Gfo/Idh/MocA family protein [Quadrisphaera sp. INWT6]|uniref:Gfo/Idh/MocA family protein n=1 Tax=Quadrisphaera sp. INWT6 TaxID=2596917 RepID=UPI0019D557E5|nr:Gfo/Idh/MocA family oxidoreductase [Quadrisphaera sp. INWT6]
MSAAASRALPTALPEPRTPDPLEAPSLRWGVMGTGWIVERFVTAVTRSTGQRFTAIGSRSGDRARAAADRLGVARAHGSWAELVADPEVDVVYVATGHADHLAGALAALEAGKAVLVEKPLALDAAEGQRIADAARAAGVFCAEALWSAYLPRWDVVRQLLDDGALGAVSAVDADLGEHFDPGHRVFDPAQHGGPLLDLATYPLALATWVLGDATGAAAVGVPHPSGVLSQVSAVLTHELTHELSHGKALSTVHTTLLGDTPTAAHVVGERATLRLPGPFYASGDVVLVPAGGSGARPDPVVRREPETGHAGLFWQAAEVARCVAAGLTETPLRPLEHSLSTLRALDAVRAATRTARSTARSTPRNDTPEEPRA